MLWMFISSLLLSQLSFMIFRVTLTPLSTFSKSNSLKCPPFGKSFTPFKELSTAFCYNWKYLYRYFYTLHHFSFLFQCGFLAAMKHFWTMQISNSTNAKFGGRAGRGGRKRSNYLAVKWMLFETDFFKINKYMCLHGWKTETECRKKILSWACWVKAF